MKNKDTLRNMLDNIINSKPDQARVDFHKYLQEKMKQTVNEARGRGASAYDILDALGRHLSQIHPSVVYFKHDNKSEIRFPIAEPKVIEDIKAALSFRWGLRLLPTSVHQKKNMRAHDIWEYGEDAAEEREFLYFASVGPDNIYVTTDQDDGFIWIDEDKQYEEDITDSVEGISSDTGDTPEPPGRPTLKVVK